MTEFVFAPVKLVITMISFYLIIFAGVVIMKDVEMTIATAQAARLSAIYPNSTNPSTGTRTVDLLEAKLREYVPIDTVDIKINATSPYTMNTIPPRTLSIEMNQVDGTAGNYYVTTKVIYGIPMPLPQVLSFFGISSTGRKIPISSSFSYWREW